MINTIPSQLKSFDEIFKDFQKYYTASYLLFLLEDKVTQKRVLFTTNPEWSKLYNEEGLIKNCCLYKVGRYLTEKSPNKSLILPWWQVSPTSKLEQEVVGLRLEHNIGQGVSITKELNGFKIFLGVAPEAKNKDFKNLYLKDPSLLKSGFISGIQNTLVQIGFLDLQGSGLIVPSSKISFFH